MLVMQFFSLISLVLVTSYAFPMKNLDDSLNGFVSIGVNENATNSYIRTADIKHPFSQSKPRILVSYSNVYKQTPIDPLQNLLMYFLMNVAKDFAQEQDQFERRRSPGFFSDAKSTFADVTNKIANESKRIGLKVGDTFKSISSREIPLESQYEETHYYPHVDGTCMCFNRLVRHGSIELKNDGDAIKENLMNDEQKEIINESSTEKRSKEVTNGQLKNEKTTELKMENHNVPSSKEKSTVAVENDRMIKDNDTVVRVLKVLDLDNLEPSKTPIETTATQKQETVSLNNEEFILDMKTIPQVSFNQNSPVATCILPFIDNSELQKKEALNTPRNKSKEDNGYYFLLPSGGTDKRTTARGIKNRELKHYKNLLPKYEDKLPHLLEAKERRKRRRIKRHIRNLTTSKIAANKDYKFLEEKFKKAENHEQKKDDNKLLINTKLLPNKLDFINSDISVLMLPNTLKDEYNEPKRRSKGSAQSPPSQQTLLLTVTLPTFLGGGIVLLALCYFLRAKGWCCQLFMDKSNIIIVDANEGNKKENTTT